MAPGPAWHAIEVADVVQRLGTSERGLSSTEAAARLTRYGHNRLRVAPPVAAWKILAAQFRSVIVMLLAAATAVAALSGDRADAIAIAAVHVHRRSPARSRSRSSDGGSAREENMGRYYRTEETFAVR
jgi:hypothetical protein